MEFQIYNMERAGDNEVFAVGRPLGLGPGAPRTAVLRIVNVVSPVLFLPTVGKRDVLLADLRAFTPNVAGVEDVVRTNIFFRSLDRELSLLRVRLCRRVLFDDFESDHCELVLTEFASPVEQLVVGAGLVGPCVAEVSVPGLAPDCAGRLFGAGGRSLTVDSAAVRFLRTGGTGDMCSAALIPSILDGVFSGFTFYDGTRLVQATLAARAEPPQHCAEERICSSPGELVAALQTLLAPVDIVVLHNFRARNRLPVGDKLVCDIFEIASGSMRGRDFSIAELAAMHSLPAQPPAAALLRIFEAMNALGLAAELAAVCGSPLGRCLENVRLERVEYTLLHALHARGFLPPPSQGPSHAGSQRYAGGLVLDPVHGFYDELVVLLDFNSLYPSIIQEYDVCFSTVGLEEDVDKGAGASADKVADGEGPPAETRGGCLSFLPAVLKSLVARRAAVRAELKTATDPLVCLALDARQKALKLTANSIYGCLGAPASRFCSYAMASRITALGRRLLSEAVACAASLGLDVVYGDTDSIMVRTGIRGTAAGIPEASALAARLSARINESHSTVEIELEKVFLRLLLCTKKKYAALVHAPSGCYVEAKGLDMERRDFCRISSELSRAVLGVILDEKPAREEDITCGQVPEKTGEDPAPCRQGSSTKAAEIYRLCRRCITSLERHPVGYFTVHSALSKAPSAYGRSPPPHVALALRLAHENKMHYQADDVVPFVVGTGTGPVGTRSFHPTEHFAVDYEFYVRHQILPPLVRLLGHWDPAAASHVELIFGQPRAAAPVARGVTFVAECCSAAVPPSPTLVCSGCGAAVRPGFYTERVSAMLAQCCTALYTAPATCSACRAEHPNHAQVCGLCGSPTVLRSANADFDEALANLEASFAPIEIPAVHALIRLHSGVSAHRTVDLSVFFRDEIARSNKNK